MEDRVLETMEKYPIEWTIPLIASKLNVTSSAVSGIMKTYAKVGVIVETVKVWKSTLYVIADHADKFQRFTEEEKKRMQSKKVEEA